VSALTEMTAEHFKGPRYDGDYITCDLPLKGARVWVRSRKPKGLTFHKLVEGNATVLIHWHYDGCTIDVEMDDGTRAAVFPALGDDIVPIGAEPASVLDRAAAIYRSQHQ
jgi:hypothetical protein